MGSMTGKACRLCMCSVFRQAAPMALDFNTLPKDMLKHVADNLFSLNNFFLISEDCSQVWCGVGKQGQ